MTQDERNRDETADGASADSAPDTRHPDEAEAPADPEDTAVEPAADETVADSDPADGEGLPEPEPADPAPPAPAPQSGGAGSMIIGGVLAAAIGAGAALVFLPEGWRRGDGAVLGDRIAALEARQDGIGADALRAALDPVETRLAALEQRLGEIESRSGPDLTPLEDRLSALEATPAGIAEQDLNAAIGALSQRLDRIEAGLDDQARSAVEAALADARAQIDARAEQLSTREEDVAAAQARIAARAALAELIAAAESGEAAPGALATVSDHAGATPALEPLAQGLPTLAGLQESFAPAARAALSADAPQADAPLGDRLVNFLRSQTGARSLAPRAGDGTDAVLSRAEAALRAGDLPGTLAELDTLSGDSASAMADWRARAETRLAALAALDELQTRLSGSEG